MEDYFTVYVKDGCPWCVKALGLLRTNEEPTMVVNVTQLTKEHIENIKEFVGWPTFPMVLYHEPDVPPRLLGGCTELFGFADEEVPGEDDHGEV
jgi:glutaredoxin